MTNEATPRPWRIDHNHRLEIKADTEEWSSIIAQVYKGGRCNANHYRMPAQANAALIVEAVNAYDALLAERDVLRVACEKAMLGIKFALTTPGMITGRRELENTLTQLRAALKGEK